MQGLSECYWGSENFTTSTKRTKLSTNLSFVSRLSFKLTIILPSLPPDVGIQSLLLRNSLCEHMGTVALPQHFFKSYNNISFFALDDSTASATATAYQIYIQLKKQVEVLSNLKKLFHSDYIYSVGRKLLTLRKKTGLSKLLVSLLDGLTVLYYVDTAAFLHLLFNF